MKDAATFEILFESEGTKPVWHELICLFQRQQKKIGCEEMYFKWRKLSDGILMGIITRCG